MTWLHRVRRPLGSSVFTGGANNEGPVVVIDFGWRIAGGVESDVEDRVCDVYPDEFGIRDAEDEGSVLLRCDTENSGFDRRACATDPNMFLLVRSCAVVRVVDFRSIGFEMSRRLTAEEVFLRRLLVPAPGPLAEQINSPLPVHTVASTVVHYRRCIVFGGRFGGRVSVCLVSLE